MEAMVGVEEVDESLAGETSRCDRAVRLALEGRYAEAEAVSREALAIDPGDIDALNELGVAVWRQDRAEEAEAIYREAARSHPDDYRVWTNLGLLLMTQDRDPEAEACFRAALAIHPRVFHAVMSLGSVVSNRGDFDGAAPMLEQALEMCPDSVEALQNAAVNLVRQGRWREALALYDRGVAIDPLNPDLRRNRAYALLATGDYEQGWPEHEWRLSHPKHGGVRINRTFWNGGRFEGQTLLLHFEQGYGDTLQFIRFAPMVKAMGGRVTLLCQPPLVRLLSRCEGVDLVCDGQGFEPACHIHAPLMSLPAILGTTVETIPARVPYLVAEPAQVEHWRSILDASTSNDLETGVRPFRIGIAWQGQPKHRADHWRSFRLADLEPIARIPGTRLVSLQAEHGTEQIAGLDGRFPIVELPGRRARDFSETAAIVANLDLVIAPDSAVAHLAGGMGVPVWMGLSVASEWRWMTGRDDSPWYPTLRLFRQSRLNDWGDVFGRMASALVAVVEGRESLRGTRAA